MSQLAVGSWQLAVGSWQLAVVISRGWGEKPGFYEILCLVTINLERNPVSEVIRGWARNRVSTQFSV